MRGVLWAGQRVLRCMSGGVWVERTNGGGHELPVSGGKLGLAALADGYMAAICLDGIPDFATPRGKRLFASPHQGQISLPDRSVLELLRQLSRGTDVFSQDERSGSGLESEITETSGPKHATNLVQTMNGTRYIIQVKVIL